MARLKRKRVDSAPFPRLIARASRVEASVEATHDLRELENHPPERLDGLRALNRKTFEETGEYMTEEEIRAFRQPRWTDRREFQDDD